MRYGGYLAIIKPGGGKQIELSVQSGYIVWRYVGDTAWTNLIAISSLIGPSGDPGADGANGREIELSTSGGYIVWRYVGDVSWTNLVSLASLTGPAGADGAPGATTYIGLTDTSDTTYTGKDLHVPVVNETAGTLDLTPTELATFFSLSDFDETAYTGKGLYILQVNSGETKIKLTPISDLFSSIQIHTEGLI